MAMSAKEFLRIRREEGPILPNRIEAQQAEEDAYWQRFGDFVEQNPIMNPHLVLERRRRGVGV